MLKRKVTAPIRYVMREDDALQTAEGIADEKEREKREAEISEEYGAYLDGECDWSKLPLKEGATPTVFTVKQMGHRQKLERDHFKGFAQSCYIFRCCVSKIENYSVELEDGSIKTFSELERKKVGELGELITDEQLADLHLTMHEISTVALSATAISEATIPLLRHCV